MEATERSPPERAGARSELAAFVRRSTRIHSVPLTGLFVLAVFYTLYAARSFFLPVALALLLSFVFSPVVRALRRIGISESLGAALVLSGLLSTAGYGAYRLAEPAQAWMLTAPESLRRIESKLRFFRKPVEDLSKMADRVSSIAGGTDAAREVTVREQSLGSLLFEGMHGLVLGGVIMTILLYFFLASGSLFLRKLVRVLPHLEEKKLAVEIAQQIESQIAAYLLFVTVVNSCLGVAVGAAMWAIGMPNPLLWGVMAALLNFVPYLGPMAGMVVLGLVGVMTFDHLGWSLVPPGIYLALHGIEANLVTPTFLGHHLALNPVMIFVSITFWGWLWGIGGALMAVPMLAAMKIVCDEIEPLHAVGEFLGP